MMAKSEASSLRKTFLLGLGKGLSKKLLQSMKMMMALQVIRFGIFFFLVSFFGFVLLAGKFMSFNGKAFSLECDQENNCEQYLFSFGFRVLSYCRKNHLNFLMEVINKSYEGSKIANIITNNQSSDKRTLKFNKRTPWKSQIGKFSTSHQEKLVDTINNPLKIN